MKLLLKAVILRVISFCRSVEFPKLFGTMYQNTALALADNISTQHCFDRLVSVF